jgi:glutathione S-transferase
LPVDHARRAELPSRLATGRAALGVMEQHLQSRRFFVAERYTIADIALYAYTHVAHEGGHDLSPYANVRAWLKRVAAEPGHIGIDARPGT